MEVHGVPAELIEEEIGNLMPFLENFAARSSGRWTVPGLLRDIMDRQRQVWCVGDWQAVVLTSVGADWVNIDAGAGIRRHEWQDVVDDELREWARALGKKRIFTMARPGWAKYGKSRGYKETHREFKLEL